MPPILGVLLLGTLSLVHGAEAACNGIFCVEELPRAHSCNSKEVCATLYFYDKSGGEIAKIQGTGQRIKHQGKSGIRHVHRVRQVSVWTSCSATIPAPWPQVGLGCYKLFRGARHNSDSFVLGGQLGQEPAGLRGTVKWAGF